MKDRSDVLNVLYWGLAIDGCIVATESEFLVALWEHTDEDQLTIPILSMDDVALMLYMQNQEI